MTDVLRPHQQPQTMDLSTLSQSSQTRLRPPTQSVIIPQTSPAMRSGQLNLDTFSPVNQRGHFEFDRVLKSGIVHKRTRKTKQWKSHYLVLRPNLLSIYKSPSEERLLEQLTLSDLTAVAYLKDPKTKRQHLFGLFSPSRNFHLQTSSAEETRAWVELIKQEARIDEEEQGMIYGSPTAYEPTFPNLASEPDHEHERYGSSSPEPSDDGGGGGGGGGRPSTHELEFYSGNEMGSYSDFSEAAPPPTSEPKPRHNPPPTSPYHHATPTPRSHPNTSQQSGLAPPAPAPSDSDERVLWHGWLLCLKSRRGVRSWKRLWAVLRRKSLTLYKGEEEYAAVLLLPLANVISAVEIDPVSRSKAHCMQIIAEDRSYRFCAPSEEKLARWLGALKCALVKRAEGARGGNGK